MTKPIPLVGDVQIVSLHSSCELRVYDSQGRVTGLVNAEKREEIPGSVYDEGRKEIVIFSPLESYRYEVAGVGEGTYGLTITRVEKGKAVAFDATNIRTSAAIVHEYTIDWNALSKGEKAATMKIDSDGDGTFEETVSLSATGETKQFPWVWIIGVVIVFVGAYMVLRRAIRANP